METTKVNFERQRLHSSIACSMRRRKIPMHLRGTDILRGVVFGRIDHPEYTIEQAVERALEFCSIPGRPESLEDGFLDLMECLDVMTKQELMHIIETLENDVRRDYCYSAAVGYLKNKGLNLGELHTELLKDMIFKKLMAEESTKKCMYEYAYKKEFSDRKVSEEEICAEINKRTSAYIGEAEDAYKYVLDAVEEIHKGK